MDSVLRFFLSALLKQGSIEVETASGRRFTVGDGSPSKAAIRFADKGAEWALLLNPALAFGELIMNDRLQVTHGSVYDVVETVSVNVSHIGKLAWIRMLGRLRFTAQRIWQRNTKRMARRNVSHHYDLDRRLYELFLDGDMQYSCAYFERDDDTLDVAQLAKKRHIAAKLLLDPGHRVLDIGCGWGGMGLYLARFCESKVVGVTLSEEQLTLANQRAKDAGFSEMTEFRLQDYRDVTEKFDRIVSVGMFEHVGFEFYDTFFKKVADQLEDNGVTLLHTIGRSSPPIETNPWILKYIFPGGHIPALSEIMPSIERAGLFVTDVEVLRLHYAKTLRAWRERFMARREEARALYDERFCRMWEFYLAAAECAFRFEDILVFQIQLAKKNDIVPLTRGYISARETELRRQDSGGAALRIAG